MKKGTKKMVGKIVNPKSVEEITAFGTEAKLTERGTAKLMAFLTGIPTADNVGLLDITSGFDPKMLANLEGSLYTPDQETLRSRNSGGQHEQYYGYTFDPDVAQKVIMIDCVLFDTGDPKKFDAAGFPLPETISWKYVFFPETLDEVLTRDGNLILNRNNENATRHAFHALRIDEYTDSMVAKGVTEKQPWLTPTTVLSSKPSLNFNNMFPRLILQAAFACGYKPEDFQFNKTTKVEALARQQQQQGNNRNQPQPQAPTVEAPRVNSAPRGASPNKNVQEKEQLIG